MALWAGGGRLPELPVIHRWPPGAACGCLCTEPPLPSSCLLREGLGPRGSAEGADSQEHAGSRGAGAAWCVAHPCARPHTGAGSGEGRGLFGTESLWGARGPLGPRTHIYAGPTDAGRSTEPANVWALLGPRSPPQVTKDWLGKDSPRNTRVPATLGTGPSSLRTVLRLPWESRGGHSGPHSAAPAPPCSVMSRLYCRGHRV